MLLLFPSFFVTNFLFWILFQSCHVQASIWTMQNMLFHFKLHLLAKLELKLILTVFVGHVNEAFKIRLFAWQNSLVEFQIRPLAKSKIDIACDSFCRTCKRSFQDQIICLTKQSCAISNLTFWQKAKLKLHATLFVGHENEAFKIRLFVWQNSLVEFQIRPFSK